MGNPLSMILEVIFPTLVEQAKYIFGLKDNLKVLIKEILELEASSADLVNEVEMQKRQDLEPREIVKLWISRVEDIGPRVCVLLEASEVELQRLCLYGYCSKDFGSTYRYGKWVSIMLKKVQNLKSEKPSEEAVARKVLPPHVEEGPTRQTVGLEKMLEATWERLMQDEVGIFGLYGMGGVGKTTLLEQINNKFLKKKGELRPKKDEFHVVIYVVVSKNLHIERIQKEVGKRVGIPVSSTEWEQKNQKERAYAIRMLLKNIRFVLLLDDIWRKVDLEEIGIPSPSPENRSKVVFTTRSKMVCGRMGGHDMEVKCLGREKAWELFLQKVRADTLTSEPGICELARIVCGKCKGLPLALTVIGETMACKTSVHDWQHAINALNANVAKYPEDIEEILKILKFSYDDLQDETVQQCFKYCALFPEDYKISKRVLVDYWIWEEIINGGGDRKIAVSQGFNIISSLLSSCMLINSQNGGIVIMHDVIRQMALWIASDIEKENFVVQTGAGLHQMPEVGNWNAVRRVSLANNEIENISVSPDCSNLTTLILQENKLVNISGEFFRSMPKLVVLDLAGNKYLTKLPEEISKLVSLRYLGLEGTSLENLPAGLRKLAQLKYLGLTGTQTLTSINVISSLVNLETLLMIASTALSLELIEDIQSLKNLEVLSVTIEEDISILERLLSIPKLASCLQDISLVGVRATVLSFAEATSSLHLSIPKLASCLQDISLDEVRSTVLSFAEATSSLRSLVILNCEFDIMILPRYWSRIPSAMCFENLTLVKIVKLRGVSDLTWLLFAPNLLHLFVFGPSPILEEIISREQVYGIMNEGSCMKPFPKLRKLCLLGLEELKSIYWEPLAFPDLELIVINDCPKLKKFPLNKESCKGNHVKLYVQNGKCFDGIEWEDEETKARFA